MISKILVGMAAAAMVSCTALAGTITFTGSTGGLSYEAKFTYSYDAMSSLGTLLIELTNTSNALSNPEARITGIAFGHQSGIANATLAERTGGFNPDWHMLQGPVHSPNDLGEFGYAVSKKDDTFTGGGGVSGSLLIGDTGTFYIDVTGTAAATLTTSDFLSTNSEGYFAAVRFLSTGPDGEGSNALPNMIIVPLPAPVWMAGAGLLAVVGYRMKRRTV